MQRATPAATFTLEEIHTHNSEKDAWVVVDGVVYDVSKFAEFHPGGKYVLLKMAGQDASEVFNEYHDEAVLTKYHAKLAIGTVRGYEADAPKAIPYADPLWSQRFNSPYLKDTHFQFRDKVRSFFVHSFVRSFVHPCIHSCIHACIHGGAGNGGLACPFCLFVCVTFFLLLLFSSLP